MLFQVKTICIWLELKAMGQFLGFSLTFLKAIAHLILDTFRLTGI
jgi:hypothetical protein